MKVEGISDDGVVWFFYEVRFVVVGINVSMVVEEGVESIGLVLMS